MIQHDPDCIFVLKMFTLNCAESMIRGDSMISVFCIGPAARGCGQYAGDCVMISMEHYSELL